VRGMESLKGQVDSIARDVLELSERAQAIGGIIATVSQLATQSNMLALNAAVEAARAGEAGRGFAVVAQEVRNLAAQSWAATEQVRELLGEIRRGVNTAVMATEEGIKGTEDSMQLTDEARVTIRQLAESVKSSVAAAEQIAAAAGQQQTGMEQIAMAMGHMRQVTTQSVAGAQQVERAAGELNDLAGQLRSLVEQYTL
ncbi:MAG: methyl-accepting chemotaxis protein, partial [Chloroflexia bacterium]|nr:methyl-accepting chemotaxis protein [Chloroflexia bacterium]